MQKTVLVNYYPNSLNATDIVQKQFCSLGKSRNQMGLYTKASVYYHTGWCGGSPFQWNKITVTLKICLISGPWFSLKMRVWNQWLLGSLLTLSLLLWQLLQFQQKLAIHLALPFHKTTHSIILRARFNFLFWILKCYMTAKVKTLPSKIQKVESSG